MTVPINLELSGLVGVGVTLAVNGFASRRARKKEIKATLEAEQMKAEVLAKAEEAKAIELALMKQSLANLEKQFTKETGGNSGGFREKLNIHVAYTADKFDVVETKLNKAVSDLAEMKDYLLANQKT